MFSPRDVSSYYNLAMFASESSLRSEIAMTGNQSNRKLECSAEDAGVRDSTAVTGIISTDLQEGMKRGKFML